jgi:predicted site-specific integrase-resolvase
MELIFCPFLERKKFCENVGISEAILKKWIYTGEVKTFKIGKRSLVDMRQWLTVKKEAHA